VTTSPSPDHNAPRPKGLVAIPEIERATHAIGLFVSDQSALEVSQAEAHVLAYLLGRTNARINDIHEEFGHRRSTLTSVLDRLERRKVLRRSIDPENRRSVIVTLTRSGTALATEVFEALRELETRALEGISTTELETFRRVVDRFRTIQ
jgi:DNA-binding MarR family transcriptional regulator